MIGRWPASSSSKEPHDSDDLDDRRRGRVKHIALQSSEREKKEASVDKKDALTIPSLYGTNVSRLFRKLEAVGGIIRGTTFEQGGSAQINSGNRE